MNILVFSDTHRRKDLIEEILLRKRAVTDLVIHLGDNYRDIADIRDKFPDIAFLGVRGNCDLLQSPDYPEESCITLEGHTIFFTHGHMFDVKRSVSLLVHKAKKKNADIALFGHTHKKHRSEVDGVLVINPGSLSEPRDLSGGSFLSLSITNGKINANIVEI